MNLTSPIRAVCFDWGGTLMSESGPEDISMGMWPTVETIAGAAECLVSLPKHLPLCIATNASVSRRPMIERALDRVGFYQYFAHIFCYTELGYRKNQPEFWQSVAATLKLPLEQIAMVGDSMEQDCVAPRAFGVQAIWFNHQKQSPAPPMAVPTVHELEQFASMLKNAA